MSGEPSRRDSLGRVTLVGAGPGDPDLLTLRGAQRLAEADLVLYDALSSDAMRVLAPKARWFYVGKRACRQSIDQDVLNRLMIREAGRGYHVVRLKCGDPFVFGRGGEEALALARAGIPCEVVPGLSSSVAGPGLLGIPVTHRGASSGFIVLTGHHERTFRPLLESLPIGPLTLVVLMGLRARATIAEVLLARGWSAKIPAAIVLGAGTAAAWRWTGALAELGEARLPADAGEAPGILVIGEVVAVAASWSAVVSEAGLPLPEGVAVRATGAFETDATGPAAAGVDGPSVSGAESPPPRPARSANVMSAVSSGEAEPPSKESSHDERR